VAGVHGDVVQLPGGAVNAASRDRRGRAAARGSGAAGGRLRRAATPTSPAAISTGHEGNISSRRQAVALVTLRVCPRTSMAPRCRLFSGLGTVLTRQRSRLLTAPPGWRAAWPPPGGGGDGSRWRLRGRCCSRSLAFTCTPRCVEHGVHRDEHVRARGVVLAHVRGGWFWAGLARGRPAVTVK
jgi:hypothetical protein